MTGRVGIARRDNAKQVCQGETTRSNRGDKNYRRFPADAQIDVSQSRFGIAS